MSNIVKTCKKHGDLTLEFVYVNKDAKLKKGFCYKCKQCTYDAIAKRPCKVHGDISPEERVTSGGCRICAIAKAHKANEKRNNNRDWFNERQRLKREANPDAWKLDRKRQYEREVARLGLDTINEMKKTKKKGITIEAFREMIRVQNNLCAICNQPETRIFNQRGEKKGQMKVCKLCIDHCHETGVVRGLLCHDCNTALGKFKENIEVMQAAIEYLKKFK